MAEVHKTFIGGGGDDWFSHIVESNAERYRKTNPSYKCPYFAWTADLAIPAALRAPPQGSNITVVGHSYGADTVFSEIQRGRPVTTLITMDPVARLRPSWTTIRSRCFVWLNVRAEPSGKNRSFDDTIAGFGGKYPTPPKPGEPGAPNYAYNPDSTHGAFDTMMRLANKQGVSGRSLLGGNGVG
ncbi:hypothetical protein C8J45_1139 [Sphingomonas sp. PP-CE-3G-477]|uniref:alpha/beta hydrolase n=1 Tax=Sphingomonas sp. PP-CE-3G-477 TaxID=2135660 RepID=UPI000D4FBC70|nr:alpha/beta hydrolase [Sphingomonas sp. PP-CE-3G-477]PTQ60058.1 hypothetical protein C8J45_1139 [Sphingomonas sp. PP-CE-3G-477]